MMGRETVSAWLLKTTRSLRLSGPLGHGGRLTPGDHPDNGFLPFHLLTWWLYLRKWASQGRGKGYVELDLIENSAYTLDQSRT